MRNTNEPMGVGELIGNSFCTIKAAIVNDSGLDEARENALRYGGNDDDLIIDTCYCMDTNFYETGIEDIRYYDSWIIVEEYDNEEEAKIGHNKWVKKMTSSTPPQTLRDVHINEDYKIK